RQIPVLERREKRRRLFIIRPLEPGRFFRPANSCQNPFVVTPQLVDAVVPARTLMLDGRLYDADDARLAIGTFVLQRPEQPRRARKRAAAGKKAADLELGVRPGFDATEHFECVPLAHEHDAVALIAATAGPLALAREIQRVPRQHAANE